MDPGEGYRKGVNCIRVTQNGIQLYNLDGQLRLNQLAQKPCITQLPS
jgi:hypothetical protein